MPSTAWCLLLPVTVFLLIGTIDRVTSVRTCPPPSDPPNGHFETRWNGLVTQYGCDPGFVLIGSAASTCLDGRWNHPAPICTPVNRRPPLSGDQQVPSSRYSVLRSLSDLQYQEEYNLPTSSAKHLLNSRLNIRARPLFSWDDLPTKKQPPFRRLNSDAYVASKSSSAKQDKFIEDPAKPALMSGSHPRSYAVPVKKSSVIRKNGNKGTNSANVAMPSQPWEATLLKSEIQSNRFDEQPSNDVVEMAFLSHEEIVTVNNASDIKGEAVKESFVSLDYERMDVATLDTSCVQQSSESVPPPNVTHGMVDTFRRRRNSEEPFNLYVEAFYVCDDGFRMHLPLVHSLYCTDRKWTGILPECVAIKSNDSKSEPGIEDDDPELGTGHNEKMANGKSCETDNGGCEHICRDESTCICHDGFVLADDGRSCQDLDECLLNGGDICEFECRNVPGSYFCFCPGGYIISSDRKSCLDKNECLLRNGHGPCQDVCTNSKGSYECSCTIPGTQLSPDNHTCEDIDECSASNFGCSHTCLNTIGTAFCTCPEGFMLGDDWKTCEDVDECQFPEMAHSCSGDRCVNTVGSYRCVPPTSSVNDTDDASPRRADVAAAVAQNETHIKEADEQDGRSVRCKLGFIRNDHDECIDVDECRGPLKFGCSHNCENLIGSASCSCPSGHVLLEDWKTCEDVDECAEDNFGCSDACINTLGSAHCLCPMGFSMDADNKTCLEVDECADDDGHVCSHGCAIDANGTTHCICPAGHELNPNGFQCDDLNECLSADGSCEQSCENVPGSYRCSCFESYELASDGHSCSRVAISCGLLSKPANGNLRPDSCLTNSKEEGEYCYFVCDAGHRLTGPSLRVCNQSGQWEPIEVPRCEPIRSVDLHNEEPHLICPPPVTVHLHPGERKAHVRIPRPKTNLNFLNVVVVEPSWIRNLEGKFPAGKTSVVFGAQGSRKLTCSVLVTVLDDEPPTVVGCPNSIRMSIEEDGRSAPVDWIEPSFEDNIGVTHVWKSKEPGFYAPGFYKVEYVARDAAGNSVRCSFNVEIIPVEPRAATMTASGRFESSLVARSYLHPPTASCLNFGSKDGSCAPLFTSQQVDLLRKLYWAFTKGCLSDQLPVLNSLDNDGGRSLRQQPSWTSKGNFGIDLGKKRGAETDRSKYHDANSVFKSDRSFFSRKYLS